MIATTGPDDPRFDVRALAGKGDLAAVARELSGDDLRSLSADAYRVLSPVVFQNHTHRLEVARRHFRCAQSFQSLEPDCLDRFYDDVEAAIEYLFRHADEPIVNLEGWVTRWLRAATVDGYRRRRGARGALQRPRLPRWLITELGGEQRLMDLALRMLEWVGIDRTAGVSLWPLRAWADRCLVEHRGDYHSAYQSVVDDVDTVLIAMRRRPEWYENFVERPLGRKQAPVAIRPHSDAATPEPGSVLREAHDKLVDAHMEELIAVAIDEIERRIAAGGNVRTVVVEVLALAFNAGTGAEDLDQRPESGVDMSDAVARRLATPRTLDCVVAAVEEVLAVRGA